MIALVPGSKDDPEYRAGTIPKPHIQPLRITYEEFSINTENIFRKICHYSDIELPETINIEMLIYTGNNAF